MRKILIYGCGGQGREVVQLIKDINKIQRVWEIVGFIDDNPDNINRIINGIPVLGQVNILEKYHSNENIYVVCAIGDSRIRKNITLNIMNTYPFVKFATLIHPSAVISDDVTIGPGTLVAAHCMVSTNVKVEDHVLINYNVTVGHDSVIEKYSSIYPGCNISGNVKIMESSIIGAGSVLLPSVTVGRKSIVGAGAVVIRNLPNDCTAVGVPARIIKYNDYSNPK